MNGTRHAIANRAQKQLTPRVVRGGMPAGVFRVPRMTHSLSQLAPFSSRFPGFALVS
ncbi:hypothetical protein GT037_004055 [Alternaria burnsii]|uniref:Uncharacterized protein n=1 Tax=Alternaria burnsii TaxID=1187904 RepID=A0A8H7B7I2_9PLEO|nr:uncharacterized protein GT037_004055 [Alternaria burnsii]KAF7678674.1 hypothetical protein GT037_004055 [Alternaria burnsii]